MTVGSSSGKSIGSRSASRALRSLILYASRSEPVACSSTWQYSTRRRNKKCIFSLLGLDDLGKELRGQTKSNLPCKMRGITHRHCTL